MKACNNLMTNLRPQMGFLTKTLYPSQGFLNQAPILGLWALKLRTEPRTFPSTWILQKRAKVLRFKRSLL